jgi:hypothetical protein
MSVQTRRIEYDFRGAHAPPVVASRIGTWASKITGAGPPTVKSVSGGSLDLALTAASEVQSATLYMGDILSFDIEDLIRVEFIAKLTAALPAAVSIAFGLASAQNDAIDSIAEHALFRAIGSNAIVVESDDGTNDVDDKPTGFSLVATYRRFAIDFSVGNLTQSPPALSKGGTADVRFFMSNDRGALTNVCRNVVGGFNMSNFTGNLQLFAQIQKTTGTAVGTLSLLAAAVEYRLPA